MGVHVAYIRPMQVVGGQVINKNDATIGQMALASMEMRIIADSGIASSSGNPSIGDYIVAEDLLGFSVAHIDNTMIVTSDSIGGTKFDPDLDNEEASGIIIATTVDANAYGIGSALHLDTDGNYIEANASAEATMPCTAIATETGTGSKEVLLHGFIRNDLWTWTPGGAVHVNITNGTLSQVIPSASGNQVQRVGIAYTANILYFNPDMTVLEIA